jgi:hypothetical protein
MPTRTEIHSETNPQAQRRHHYRRYLLLRPWVAAMTLIYLLYWVYVYIVWS